jgi:hypothetical protein
VQATIERDHAEIACFFQVVGSTEGPFAQAFVPTLETLGYREIGPLPTTEDHPLVGYCRK